jgi:hypothetical protein
MKTWDTSAVLCAWSALFLGCFATATIGQTNEPKKFYKSYRLLPHQEAVVMNKEFRDVYVHADLPVSVKVGDCFNASTVDWHCSGDPHNVVIVDQRKASASNSEKNGVEITFVED